MNGRNSPSFPNSSPANWSNSAPVWAPSWNQGGGGGGWPATAEPAWGNSGNHTTNPFGSSPSGAINLGMPGTVILCIPLLSIIYLETNHNTGLG